jgi:RNA polymerase sigma-70 factor (ECF subfamily)
MAEVRGAPAVAETFSGRARAARPAVVGGAPGLVWMQHGRANMVFDFTIANGRVVGIDLIADPERISELDVTVLGA